MGDSGQPRSSASEGLPGPDPAALLRGLTPEQHAVVVSEAAPLCVIAGAGSGKTRVLTHRLAYRVRAGTAEAERSVVVTFTRKAAGELRRRLVHLQVDQVTVGTFHSLALSIHRQHWADRRQVPPAILDDPARLIASFLADTGVPARPAVDVPDRISHRSLGMLARAVSSEIEWAQACAVLPEAYPAAATAAQRRPPLSPAAIADIYQCYQQTKHRKHVMDLHDLVTGAARLVQQDDALAQALRWRRRHFFVDEFQDVNPAQWSFLLSLVGDRPDLFVVGDPEQAIYSWNGSDPSLMTSLDRRIPGTTVLTLATNHRSTPQIVAAATSVRATPAATGPAQWQGPPPAPSPTARAAPSPTTRAAPSPTTGAAPGGQATPPPPPLSVLSPDGPAPVVRGFDTDADEAAAVARWLRLQHHPGRPWTHLAVLARTRARLGPVAEALDRAGIPYRRLAQAPTRSSERSGSAPGPAVPPAGQSGRQQSTAAQGELAPFVGVDPDLVEPDLIDDTSEDRVPENLQYRQAVTLATMHQAKGLEWPAVAVVGLEDGLVPSAYARSPLALAEERRVLYVAVTRAETDLWCSWARHRPLLGAPDPATASPWLAAIEAAGEPAAIAPAADAIDRLHRLRAALTS